MKKTDHSVHLKSEFRDLPTDTILRSPITVINGITSQAANVLKSLDINNVFELAHSRFFNSARKLTVLSESAFFGGQSGLVPADVINSDLSTNVSGIVWKDQPISSLKGISAQIANTIETHLSMNSIGDFAFWPPFLAARDIAGISDKPANLFVDEGVPQELVPKFNDHASEKCFYAVYVIDEDGLKGREELLSAVEMEKHLLLGAPEMPRTGAILRYEQSWTPVALTLGNLLHSLALAPGESTRIAIIDWTRRQGVRTTENISQLESLANTIMQTRSISEVTRAVAREAQGGFSKMNSNSTVSNNAYSTYGLLNGDEVFGAVTQGVVAGAGAGAVGGGAAGAGIGAIAGTLGGWGVGSVPGFVVGGVAGGLVGAGAGGLIGGTAGGVGSFLQSADFGSSQSNTSETDVETVTTTSSSGSRNVEAEMAQNIDDRTHQHSSTSRNKHASIVQEVSQQENEKISTRVVTNYNHMYALTIQYFEVVQIYNVRTTLVKKQPCLYIPFLPIKEWNVDLIRMFRKDILRAALNPDAAYTLIAGENIIVLESPTYSLMAQNSEIFEHTLQIWKSFITQQTNRLRQARALLNAHVSNDPVNAWRLPRHFMITYISVPSIPGSGSHVPVQDAISKRELIFHYRDGSQQRIEVPIFGGEVDLGNLDDDHLKLDNIAGITYEITEKDPDLWNFAKFLNQEYEHQSPPQRIWNITIKIQEDRTYAWDHVRGDTIHYSPLIWIRPENVTGNKIEIPVINMDRSLAMADLVSHLNDNSSYYTGRILKKKSNPLVRQILNHYSYNGKRLINLVDQEPVAITGNSLVFLLHEEITKKAGPKRNETGFVAENSLVPVATGGVFAEAVQGRANAAEKLDITRFWNWQESPIPIVAPEIAPIQSGSRATSADVRPGGLDTPLAQYVTPAAMPAPQGMSSVLNALSTQMFRDMSGIAQTAQLAQSSLEEAVQGATASGEQASQNLKNGLGFTKEILGKVIDMNRQFAELMVKSGMQAIQGGLPGSKPVNLGNSSATNAGLMANWGKKIGKSSNIPGLFGQGSQSLVSQGSQLDSHSPGNPGNLTQVPGQPGTPPSGTIGSSSAPAGTGFSPEKAAFWNALGQTLTGGIHGHRTTDYNPDPTLLAAEGHFVPPGASALAWPEEMDTFPPFYLSLMELDDNFFTALNVPKNDVLGLSISEFNDLMNAYWMRRFDLKTMGDVSGLTNLHATIDRFYVSFMEGTYLDHEAFENIGGLANYRIPPEESWTKPGSAGNDWLKIAGLVILGEYNTDADEVVEWDIEKGAEFVMWYWLKGAESWRKQIDSLLGSTNQFAKSQGQEMENRYYDWLRRKLEDYKRVAELLAPDSPMRETFLVSLQSSNNDIFYTNIKWKMKNEGPGPVYRYIDQFIDNQVYGDVWPGAAYNALPSYIKLLWTSQQFVRANDKNKIYYD